MKEHATETTKLRNIRKCVLEACEACEAYHRGVKENGADYKNSATNYNIGG